VLHNLGLEDLRVADINKMQRVALGAKALLREGQKWLLGAGNAARLALVTMQSV
jgi:hypothetical protein